jgi:TIR domain
MKIFVIGGTTVPESDNQYPEQRKIVEQVMRRFGKDLLQAGHDLLVCSPFPEAVDIEAVRGAVDALGEQENPVVEFHYPDASTVVRELTRLRESLSLTNVRLFPHPPPTDENSREAWMYAWLLAQLSAMERSNAVVALGGKMTGPSNLLLLLAEGQRKSVLPLSFLGGAAAQSFQRRRYELTDRFGDRISVLNDSSRIGEAIALVEVLAADHSAQSKRPASPRFFISYARERPQEADFVEMTLRRRNYTVFRDERDFGAGHSVPGEITEYIYRADIFIAVWCKEYACSPWCFDELDLALKRHERGKLTLWLLCADGTRIVPPAARELTNYPVRTREELEGRILMLLEQIQSDDVGSV